MAYVNGISTLTSNPHSTFSGSMHHFAHNWKNMPGYAAIMNELRVEIVAGRMVSISNGYNS